MVFYFTGTGNSLYVAKNLDKQYISIPQVIHNGSLHFADDRIGIVAPVYGYELPDMVNEFIEKATFDTPYFYVIATYGSGHGGAGTWISDLLSSSRKKADYIEVIEMPDNYLPEFDMEEQRQRENTLFIEEHIQKIKQDIDTGKQWIRPSTQIEKSIYRQAIGMKRRIVTDQFISNLYSVGDQCVGCGICTKVCPAGCFGVKDGRAVQNSSGCQMCMACIHACPQKAIHLNIPDRNPNARFRNSHVELQEIIAANNQI